MKTIEEHNREKYEHYALKEVGTGVQCPHCGDEMFESEPDVVLLTFPPRKKVHCKSCKYKTTLIK
jgi:hypothetical protein